MKELVLIKYDECMESILNELKVKKDISASTRVLADPKNPGIINRCLTFSTFDEAYLCSEWLYYTFDIVSKQDLNNPRHPFYIKNDPTPRLIHVIVTLREATEVHKLLNNKTFREIQKSLNEKDNIKVEIGLAHDDNKIRTPVLLFEKDKGLQVSEHLSIHFGISGDNGNGCKNICSFEKKMFINGREQQEKKVLSSIVISYEEINKAVENKKEINKSTSNHGVPSKGQAARLQNTQFQPQVDNPSNSVAMPINNGVDLTAKNQNIRDLKISITWPSECKDALGNRRFSNICSPFSTELLSSSPFTLSFSFLSVANEFCEAAFKCRIGNKDLRGNLIPLKPETSKESSPWIVLTAEQVSQVREACR